MPQPTVVVVGSINMDLVVQAQNVPESGQNVHGHGFRMVPGGKGANQAVASARLGAAVRLIGGVGHDSFGAELTANLAANGVDITGVARNDAAASGVAMIVVDAEGENTIIAAAGANEGVLVANVLDHAEAIKKADVLLVQLEVPYDTVEAAIRLARANGVKVVLDAGPPCTGVREVFFDVDVLSPNEAEAEAMLGTEISDLIGAEAAGQELLSRGAGTAVIKLGSRGAMLVTPQGGQHFPPFEVEVVDTTGAGDAFTAALAVQIAGGAHIEEAVAFANAAGAVAVTKLGAQDGAPTWQEVEHLLEQGACNK